MAVVPSFLPPFCRFLLSPKPNHWCSTSVTMEGKEQSDYGFQTEDAVHAAAEIDAASNSTRSIKARKWRYSGKDADSKGGHVKPRARMNWRRERPREERNRKRRRRWKRRVARVPSMPQEIDDFSPFRRREAYCTVCEKFFTGDLVDHRRSSTHKVCSRMIETKRGFSLPLTLSLSLFLDFFLSPTHLGISYPTSIQYPCAVFSSFGSFLRHKTDFRMRQSRGENHCAQERNEGVESAEWLRATVFALHL